MTNVQIRDVPEDVLADLKTRAARRDQSLQRYLRGLLLAEAGVERNSRLFARISADFADCPGLDDDGADTAEIIRRGREERDKHLGIEP